MNECLWCDAPTEEKLCPECRAVNDHPPYHCTVDARHLPTLGDSCAECFYIAEAKARRAVVNAPIIESLRAIKARHVAEWDRPWPGLEFAKGLLWEMLNRAIDDLS